MFKNYRISEQAKNGDDNSVNKRLEVSGVGEQLQVKTASVPKPPPNGFILKTHYSGICHTDVHVWQNKVKISEELVLGLEAFIPGFSYPIVLGHEFSGEIYAIGSEYKGDKKVGDRVAVYPWQGCEQCHLCAKQETTRCVANIAFSCGIGREGGYQSFVSVPNVKFAVGIPRDVDSKVACLFGCSALTAYNAVCDVQASIEKAHTLSGSGRLLIIGAGGVGLWAIQWARALLPKTTNIFVADITEEKLKLAKELGATNTIVWSRDESDEELIAKSKEASGGGFDGCIDLVGIAPTVNKAFQCANKGGHIAIVGIAGGIASIPIFALVVNMVTVSGIYTGTIQQMKKMIKEYLKHKDLIRPPPMTVVTPEGAQAALTDLCDGKISGRTLIDFSAVRL